MAVKVCWRPADTSGMRQNDEPRRGRESRFAGLRLVGIFVPWQAVALTLAVVVALAGLAGARWAGGGKTRVDLASAGEATTSTTGAVESTTTTTSATTTTAETPTSTTGPAKATAPKPTSTTTTMAPPPATCAVMRSAVTGTVSSSWAPSATRPGTWDRHITATVTNPIGQPVVLGYIATMSSATSYVFQLAESHGRHLAAGESVTVEDVYSYAGDHTQRGYSPPPDKLYSVEFSPVSAPELFCRTDLDHPGETQGAKPHPTVPFVYFSPDSIIANGVVRQSFRVGDVFPGLRVRYRMLMKDDTLKEFTTDVPVGFQGVLGQADVSHRLEDLKDFGVAYHSGHIPWFQGITAVEWGGTPRACTAAISNACAPNDGSLLDRLPY